MSENVNIDLSGEINATTEKKGLQKYVNDMDFFRYPIASPLTYFFLLPSLNRGKPFKQAGMILAIIIFGLHYTYHQVYRSHYAVIVQQITNGAGPALLMGVLATRRPWTQFVATENFKAPASLPRLSRRFYRNVEHFQANYIMVFLGLFVYCLITSPLLLIAMVGSFFGYRKLTSGPNTWKIGGWELTKTQQYVVAAACSMAICWLAGAGAVLFWVLGATVTVVALHASFFDAEALPPSDDPEQFPMIEQV